MKKVIAALLLAGLATPAIAELNNFRFGMILSDYEPGEAFGNYETSDWVSEYQMWSEWIGDADKHDFNYAQVDLETNGNVKVFNTDFRLCLQLSDKKGTAQIGKHECTPWASQGGGWSPYASDSTQHDPDMVRVKIETRSYNGLAIKDFRIGIRLTDKYMNDRHAGHVKYTPYMSQGGGKSSWASDDNEWDPNSIKLFLDIGEPVPTSGGDGGDLDPCDDLILCDGNFLF